MGEEQSITVNTVQAYMAQPTDDGTQMGLVLKVASEMKGFAFSHMDFARFAAKVMETAIANSHLLGPGQADDAHTLSLPVQAVSFESDSTDPSKVTITCHLGPLQMVLTLDADTLFTSLKSFLARRRVPPTSK